MDYLYEYVTRPLFFRFCKDAEKAHDRSLLALRAFAAVRPLVALMERFNMKNPHLPPQKPIELFGLKFPNVVGVAAGYDKQARVWTALGALGFGHVEIGTVTHLAQSGNEKPRLFRYPKFEAAVNSFGFPNDGAEEIAARIAKGPKKGKRAFPLGINIGKSKVCPIENAVEDYLGSFRALADHADYVSVNISSPNTPNLRELHDRKRLVTLLSELQKENRARALRLKEKPLPMLLKIAPDLSYAQVDDVISVVEETEFNGLIATNTTVSRPEFMGSDVVTKGGLSGAPLMRKSVDMVRYIVRATDGKLPVIGSGGICRAEDADRFLAVGASLIQIYTGMVYRGPFFARELAQGFAWNQTGWPAA